MSDLDHGVAVDLGGWDRRYSVVLATAGRDSVAAAWVDTNGGGADIDIDQYERGAAGLRVAGVSFDCGAPGAFSTGFMGVAWGQSDPRTIC
ncbi:hypothetical protein [Nocardioides sp. LHG3406-4]|uniref:hypothetical protein n=1 Tax=Nocardioides sp. LHG3406-4 TaxID=2804575 RepID=UPI003CF3520E